MKTHGFTLTSQLLPENVHPGFLRIQVVQFQQNVLRLDARPRGGAAGIHNLNDRLSVDAQDMQAALIARIRLIEPLAFFRYIFLFGKSNVTT